MPYFDWSFDAPTTAYRGDERKSFWISATVRVMVKVEWGSATEILDQIADSVAAQHVTGMILTLSFLFASMPRVYKVV